MLFVDVLCTYYCWLELSGVVGVRLVVSGWSYCGDPHFLRPRHC